MAEGSVQLNAQELRHGINFGYLVEKLDEMAKNEKWRKLVGIRVDKRMKGSELILRFLAFRHMRASYSKPLSGFLDTFSSHYKAADEVMVDFWATEFSSTVDRVHKALGKLSFRIYEKDFRNITPFNSALYDAQMIGFSETVNPIIRTASYDPINLQKAIFSLISEEKFSNAIRRATSDEGAVRYRIDTFIKFLDEYNEL